jgi:hypothetical protein
MLLAALLGQELADLAALLQGAAGPARLAALARQLSHYDRRGFLDGGFADGGSSGI